MDVIQVVDEGTFWNPITYAVFLPLLGALVLLLVPRTQEQLQKGVALATTLATAAIGVFILTDFDYDRAGDLQYYANLGWIEVINSRYIVGLDGISLPLFALTMLVVPLCIIYSWNHVPDPGNVKAFFALLLVLETGMLGSFVAQDLILFFVFFEVVLLPMYFLIGVWGGEQRQYASIKFFLFTLFGSALMIVAFLALYFLSDQVLVGGEMMHSFDMTLLPQLAATGVSSTAALWIFGGMFIGFGIKVPMFPFHTWLPDAHTQAPTGGSVVLAGVLLKMGTYGFVRIAMPMLPEAWRDWAWVIIVVGIVSVVYGALVALAQTNVKRMVAYTSVNHMGYIVLAVGAAGLIADDTTQARSIAVTGAVTQMVSHGLITGALFLLAGVLQDRAATYDMDSYGGLAGPAPRFAAFFAVGAFASLGLPGLSGFIAEFQIFTGSIAAAPVTAIALVGILLTAALFLRALQRIFTGETRGRSVGFTDLRAAEVWSVGPLLVLSLLIGVFPRPLLAVIEPAAEVAVELVGR